MRVGVDYSAGRPGGAALAALGYTFAVRYVAAVDPNKYNLSHDEADDLAAHGLDVVVVCERQADFMLGGAARGRTEAAGALQVARTAGLPAGRPIYFGVDFNATRGGAATSPAAVADMRRIADFCAGAATVIGEGNVGVYGSYWVVDWLARNTNVRWYWQCMAWSNGLWHPRAQLHQDGVNRWVKGVNCDHNTAVAADFGQWRPGGNLPAVASLPVLRVGSRGDAVKLLQYSLNLTTLYRLAVDGIFGPATTAAVVDWQRRTHLHVDGIVGPQTWLSLHLFLVYTKVIAA